MAANLKLTYIGTGTVPLFLSDIEVTPGGPKTLKLPSKSWMVLKYAGDVITSHVNGAISQFVSRGLIIAELTNEPLQPATRINAPSGPAGGGLSGTYPNPTSAGLNVNGQVRGSVLYFDGASWAQLPPGLAGGSLTTNGVGATPTWASPTPAQAGAASNFKEVELHVNSFTFDQNLSTHTLESPSSGDPGAIAYARLFVNGVRDVSYKKVSSTPNAAREWRLAGASLEIFGDVRATSDIFNLEYISLTTVPPYKEERFRADSFVYSEGVSRHTLQAQVGTDPGAIAYARLFVNGVRDVSYKKVSSTPAMVKEWRVLGALLEIFGDIIATGNTYDIEYL